MARKRENAPELQPDNSGRDSDEPEKPSTRLSVTLGDDGKIAWDRMRPETRDKLRGALGGEFSAGAQAGAIVEDALPPELCAVIYDSAAMLLIGLARRGGYTAEQAQVLNFTPQEKDALIPLTAKVANKYGVGMGKYQDEITLGVLVVTIISGKLALLRKSATVVRIVPSTSDTPSQEGM